MNLMRAKLAFAGLLILPILSYANTETYKLDPTHSYVSWQISHFGFSNPSGKWMANGTLAVDEKKPQDSKVNVIIKVADLVTGIPKLDEHLQGADFFDVTKYPDATFVSDKINVTSKGTAKLYGTLTLHGVSKPVVLNVKLNKVGISPITHKKTAGFTATGSLNRSDFGMKTYLPGLGDQVKLHIEVEAVLDATDAISKTN